MQAMREGSFLLLDEISLADDAVLERLNSVLEPGRKLTLAEKGGDVVEEIVAHPNFRIFATMNPGGDFGKKELSPALRNRFTEIWVPEITDPNDLLTIITDQMAKHGDAVVDQFASPMLHFVTWFNNADFVSSSAAQKKNKKKTKGGASAERSAFFMTLRDILSWITFIGTTMTGGSGDHDDGKNNVRIVCVCIYFHAST